MPRLLRAICVIGVGLCAALPFRRPAPPPQEDQRVAQDQPRLLQENQQSVDLTVGHPAPSEPVGVSHRHPPVTPIGHEDGAPDSRLTPATQTPELPQVTLLADPFPPARGSDWAGTTHVLSAGDTLRGLAERYLGSSGRGDEILNANRQLLADPRQLPVGTRILIPAPGRSPEPAVSAAAPAPRTNRSLNLPQRASAQHPSAPLPGGAGPLVPVVRSPVVLD